MKWTAEDDEYDGTETRMLAIDCLFLFENGDSGTIHIGTKTEQVG